MDLLAHELYLTGAQLLIVYLTYQVTLAAVILNKGVDLAVTDTNAVSQVLSQQRDGHTHTNVHRNTVLLKISPAQELT